MGIELARSQDGFHVPFSVEGVGPPDIVHVLGRVAHQQLNHLEPPHGYYERLASFSDLIQEPRFQNVGRRLAKFSRLIVMDERGGPRTDLAHEASSLTLEGRMEDITAVLDAVGCDQVTLIGDEDTSPVVLLYAAIFPTRVHSLVSLGMTESIFDLEPAIGAVRAPLLVLLGSGEDAWLGKVRHLLAGICTTTLARSPGSEVWDGDVEVFAGELQHLAGGAAPDQHHESELATILFTDMVDSTRTAAEVGASRWVQLLDQHDALLRHHVDRFGGRVIRTTGDGVLATFSGPAKAIRCACSIRQGAKELGIEIRAGLHLGEFEWRGSDIAGIAVHIASRVESLARPGEVWVSSAIPPLVAGSGISFLDRGEHALKGVPGLWKLFAGEIPT